jgi:hypothetical protein
VSTVSQEYFSNNSTLGDSKNRWANGFINTIYLGNTALTNDEPVAALNDANIYVSIKNKFSNWRINNYLSIDTGSWSSGGALTWDHTFTWPNVITDNSFTIEKSTTSITESQTLPTSWQKCLIIDNNGDTTITGDLTLTNGNVIIGSTGKGIDFSVTAEGVAGVSGSLGGEILNDYEEGTFTPYLEGTTTAGTWSYTYNAGYYTKIGDTVIINGAVDVISTAGSVGQILMKGFPFVSRTAGLGIYPFTVSWTTFTTAIDRLNLILGTNSSTAGFSYSIGTVTNSENTNLSGSNIGSGRIRFSGVYKTNS